MWDEDARTQNPQLWKLVREANSLAKEFGQPRRYAIEHQIRYRSRWLRTETVHHWNLLAGDIDGSQSYQLQIINARAEDWLFGFISALCMAKHHIKLTCESSDCVIWNQE